ncbi:MAG: hypothetical protein IJP01_00095 [Oscillospiraceae bacterium]|nr:hypothetical protein [Oscillospiraceae bacterium]
MVYLLLAIGCSSLISLVMRLSEKYVHAKKGMLVCNYMVCSLMGAAFAGFGSLLPQSAALPRTLAMGALNGVLYLAGFLMLQWCVGRYGVVMSSVFMRMGLLVPLVLSILLFHEQPSLTQTIGFGIAIGAILLINMKRGEAQSNVGMGLILLLLASGMGDAMSKVYEVYGDASLSQQFLFYTFASAGLLCTALLLLGRERIGRAELFFGVLIGIPNFLSARFLLLSLDSLPAVIAYPTYAVATILVVTVAGVILFKEKLQRRQWTALAAILAALALLNI